MRFRFALPGLSLLVSLACASKPEPVSPTPSPEPPPVEPAEPEPPSRSAKLITASSYGCMLDDQGALWCWGFDPVLSAAARAKGDSAEQAVRVHDLPSIRDVDGSENGLCILGETGELRCWIDYRELRIQVELDRAAERVFVVGTELCLLDEVATLRCGGLVEPTEPSFDRRLVLREIAERVRDVEVDFWRACALDEDGAIWCWGRNWNDVGEAVRNDHGVPRLATIEGAIDIEFDPASGNPRLSDRTLVLLDSGQLVEAVETRTGPALSVELRALEGFAELAAFGVYAGGICGLGADHRVRCQGDNRLAQLGQAHTRASAEPLVVEALDAVEALEIDHSHACVIHDGDPWCWGLHEWNQYQDDEDFHELTLDEVVSVVAHNHMVCASTAAGPNLCWGTLFNTLSVGVSRLAPAEHGLVALSTPTPLSLSLGRLVDFTGRGARHCLRDAVGEVACVDIRVHEQDRGEETVWVSPASWVESFRRSGLADFERLDEGWCGLSKGQLHCETDGGASIKLPRLRNVTDFELGVDDVLCAVHGGGKVSCFELGRGKATRVSGLDDVVSLEVGGDQEMLALDGGGFVHHWYVLESLPPPSETLGGFVLSSRVAGPPWKFAVFGLERHVDFSATQQIELAKSELCGLGLDGRITCESAAMFGGFGGAGRVTKTLPLRDVVQIVGEHGILCALTKAGRVACRGDDRLGALGRPPGNLIMGPRKIERHE